jgi:hypothetical protein
MLAAQRGVTLKHLLRTAVEAELSKIKNPSKRRITFPIHASKNPGTLALTNAEIEDLLT